MTAAPIDRSWSQLAQSCWPQPLNIQSTAPRRSVVDEDERGSDVAHPGVVEGSLDHVDVRGQVLPGDVPVRRIDDHR